MRAEILLGEAVDREKLRDKSDKMSGRALSRHHQSVEGGFMKFTRLAFAVPLSLLLVGVALSTAQTNALPGKPTPSLFLVVVGNSTSGNSSGQLAIYPLVGGVPQDVSSPYEYSIAGIPGALSVSTTPHHLYIASAVLGTHGDIGGILGYQYNGENGFTLTKLPGSPFHPTGYEYGYGLAGDYADDFLYASNYGNNNISGFQVASNGSLAWIMHDFGSEKRKGALKD
jgi:hypothetical protein